MTKVLCVLLSIGFVVGCTSPQAQRYVSVSPEVFEAKLESSDSPQLLDVRTPSEVAAGHIEGQVSLDYMALSEAEFMNGLEQFDTEKPIFVYCKSGGRSKKSCSLLQQAGFKEIYELDGGYKAWSKK